MKNFCDWKIFAKIHHDYKHYITIEIFCDRVIFRFRTFANIRKKISSQINSSLQYSMVPFLVIIKDKSLKILNATIQNTAILEKTLEILDC